MLDETSAVPPPAAPLAPPAAPLAPSAAPPAPPPIDPTIPIPKTLYDEMVRDRAALGMLQREQQQRELSVQQEQARILAQKGQIEESLKLLREQSETQLASERAKLAATEERTKRYALDSELARALSGQPLASSAAAAQLATLFRNEFVVEPQGDSFVVRTPTFQTVSDFIAARLAQPEYAHFVRPGTAGGTAGGATSGAAAAPTSPANPAVPSGPKNMGEAVILHMQNLKKAEGDPRMNPGMGFGLHPTAVAK